jgi:hypothetical protein
MSDDEERICLICLENPQKQNPLFLLQCGCRTSWFHEECKKEWIKHINYPPKCPTCRRSIEFTVQYSFAFRDGMNQQFFWWSMNIFLVEVFMAIIFTWNGYYQVLSLPGQSILILSIPYIFSSHHDLLYFLHHLRYRYLTFAFIWCFHIFKNKKLISLYPDDTLNLLVAFGAIHVFYLLLQEIHYYFSPFHYAIDPHVGFIVGFHLPPKETLVFIEKPTISPSKRKITVR